jgi:hypothetical protein
MLVVNTQRIFLNLIEKLFYIIVSKLTTFAVNQPLSLLYIWKNPRFYTQTKLCNSLIDNNSSWRYLHTELNLYGAIKNAP